MNADIDDAETTNTDASAAGGLYRSIASETPPPHLDRNVLRQAANEVRRDALFQRFLPWMRPAAFAATVALCLALLFELDEPALIDGVPPALPESDSSVATLDEFASAASDSSSRIREIAEATAAQTQTADPAATLLPRAKDGVNPERFCDDEQTATPETWWACIEALREAGRAAAADAELRRLNEAHPDFPSDRQ